MHAERRKEEGGRKCLAFYEVRVLLHNYIYENILFGSMGVNGSAQCIEFARE